MPRPRYCDLPLLVIEVSRAIVLRRGDVIHVDQDRKVRVVRAKRRR